MYKNPIDETAISEKIWSVLFPEGTNIRGHEDDRIVKLREKRTVTIDKVNTNPVKHPAKQILFTSNVLLTTPLITTNLSEFDQDFQSELNKTLEEPQGKTIFLMTTSQISEVLLTIQSRVRHYNFSTTEDSVLREYLKNSATSCVSSLFGASKSLNNKLFAPFPCNDFIGTRH